MKKSARSLETEQRILEKLLRFPLLHKGQEAGLEKAMNPATLQSLLPSVLTVFVSSTLPLVGVQAYTFNALNARIDRETNLLTEDFDQFTEGLDAGIQAVDDKVDALTSEVQFLKGQLSWPVSIQTSQTRP